MRIVSTAFFILFIIIISQSFAEAQFIYISPQPGSLYHNPVTNIILKNGDPIDKKSLDPALVKINGSTSGMHSAKIILSEDGKTIVIYPVTAFSFGETVSVIVSTGFRKLNGEIIHGNTFSFSIHPERTLADKLSMAKALDYVKQEETTVEGNIQGSDAETVRDLCNIPGHTVTSNGNEYKADVFYYNFRVSTVGCFGRTILTNEGDSVFAEFNNDVGINFTINKNGYLTYYNKLDSGFEMMDTLYNVINHFYMQNGYFADEHELLVFPDGHSFMFCYDVQPNVDLSSIGGLDTVDVIGCVIQELDADQQVIFEWRTWDHMLFSDAIYWVENQLPGNTLFDWVHANSMELDYDGNLLVSFRHLCEITKINLATGDMMWRLGGDNNQFTFLNDPDTVLHFSGQHDFRRLADGNYTLFNNGNGFSVPLSESSAKEYSLDQTNKIATLVWKYTHPLVNGSKVFAAAMGSVQRLPNKNTFIDWGLIPASFPAVPRFTEVDSTNNIVWEFNFLDTAYYISYRAHKFDWNRCPPPIDSTFELTYVGSDSAVITWAETNFNSGFIFQYKLHSEVNWTSVSILTNIISLNNLMADSVYDWRVQATCSIVNDSSAYSSVQQFTTVETATNFDFGDQSFNIFPNPASDHVDVSLVSNENCQMVISIENILGSIVCKETWPVISGVNDKRIKLNNLPSGIYSVEIRADHLFAVRQLIVR